MRTLEVTRRALDRDAFIGRVPTPNELGSLVSEPTLLVEDGRAVAVYTLVDAQVAEPMRRVVATTKYQRGARTLGLPMHSSLFGALPRIALRNDFCRYSTHSIREPGNFAVVRRFGDAVSALYERYLPEAFAANMQAVQSQVLPDWWLGNQPFTSCILNYNQALKYHTDTGNFAGVFSNVFILRRACAGGQLALPEFGLSLAMDDRALVMFDGQRIIHGVHPLRPLRQGGYRCSIVFFALDSMRHCYPLAEELERARRMRTVRERRRAGVEKEEPHAS